MSYQGMPRSQPLLGDLDQERQYLHAGYHTMSTINNNNNESPAGTGPNQPRAAQAIMAFDQELSPALSMEAAYFSDTNTTSNSPAYPQSQQWPHFTTTGVPYQMPAHFFPHLATIGEQEHQQPPQLQPNQVQGNGNNYPPQTMLYGQQQQQGFLHQRQQYAQPVSAPAYQRVPLPQASSSFPDQPLNSTTMGPQTSNPPCHEGSIPQAVLPFPTPPPNSTIMDQPVIPKPRKKSAQPQTHASQASIKVPKHNGNNNNHSKVVKSPGLDKKGGGGGGGRKRRASSASSRSRANSASIKSSEIWQALCMFMVSKEVTLPQLKEAITIHETSPTGANIMSHGAPLGFPSTIDPSTPVNHSPNKIRADKQKIIKMYSGYQKESRPKEPKTAERYKCTMGCNWSHNIKSNWERHERTHYPPEIWICSHDDCLENTPKQRVSFRKDLARRHHTDHHQVNGQPNLTGLELEELRVSLKESLFPRECVFHGCRQRFSTFEERKTHIESHLKRSDVLDQNRIVKFYAEDHDAPGSDDDGEHEIDEEMKEEDEDEDEEANDDDRNDKYDDDSDDDDDDDGSFHGGNGGSAGSGGKPGNSHPGNGHPGRGPPTHPGKSHSQQGFSQMSNSSAGGYGNWSRKPDSLQNEAAPGIGGLPRKTAKLLRLLLWPQIFARGIAQTPIVLKKMQLHAALILDLPGVKKTQVINVLRREIAMMASALPSSPGPTIKRFPRLTAMTKLLPDLTKSVSRIDMSSIAKQNQAILKFAGFRKDVMSQELEDPGGPAEDSLHDRLAHFEGGHIYHCFSVPLPKSTAPIRPSRLLHVGTKKNPKLHLDTSEMLPSYVNYCSLSHCWDDGHGLSLSTKNVASLKHSIQLNELTQSFHVAINIARDKGLEYLWIDTLCIMLDSDEDIQAEAPRITEILASATFSIIVTSVVYDGDAARRQQQQQQQERQRDGLATDGEPEWDEKSVELLEQDMSNLALTHLIEKTLPDSEQNSGQAEHEEPVIPIPPPRRDSHQLESFLAEPAKRSFFSASHLWNKTSLTLSSRPTTSPSQSQVDTDRAADADETQPITSDKRPSRIETYLKNWHFQWQRDLPSESAPVSSAASIVTSKSPAPSLSDKSAHSGKKRSLLPDLTVAFERLFHGSRVKHRQQHMESNTPDG